MRPLSATTRVLSGLIILGLGWATTCAAFAEVENGQPGPGVPCDYPLGRLAISVLKQVEPDAVSDGTLGSFERVSQTRVDAWQAFEADRSPEKERRFQEASKAWGKWAEDHPTLGVDAILMRLHRAVPDEAVRLMVYRDWIRQASQEKPQPTFRHLVETVLGRAVSLESGARKRFEQRIGGLRVEKVSDFDPAWRALFLEVCLARREARLRPHRRALGQLVFTKHHDIGGQHYAYTDDVSDSPYNDNNPFPHGGALCLWRLDEGKLFGRQAVLVAEPDGLVRDPEVSFDGRRVLFARRTSMTDDDYHVYEMTLADRTVRQITHGQGVSDIEPCYLPDGDILFVSTRCQQIVDCWWADVGNLYRCGPDGRFLRRLGFDQVHTNYPKMLDDGRVVYTRWDYNDRGQLFPQPLFQMNPDGTGQTEFYGNNSWFPTTVLHARGIPGTQKVLCVLSGHHTYQKGKLAIIDPALGRQENLGVQLVAPVRKTDAVRVDMYGAKGHQFQYPFPLNEREYLVTFSVVGSKIGRAAAEEPFGVYYMAIDGRRELLVADPTISCNQPMPTAARKRPHRRATAVDYRDGKGAYYVHDVYRGPGLAGIARGTIRRIRVVALEFRAGGVGSNQNRGPGGGALVSTPISINGSWDVKRVLGTAPVYPDGSAAFEVPARTALYFQLLDEHDQVVQTMRSWSTLQPGESFSCVGCHESKNTTPPADADGAMALVRGAVALEPEHGTPDGFGFSFPKLVQPILDRHCVSCHNRGNVAAKEVPMSLEGTLNWDETARKSWSDAYRSLADVKRNDWPNPQSVPTMLPPYFAGSVKSPFMRRLREGHNDVRLSADELARLACWIDLGIPYSGSYTEGMKPEDAAAYEKWQLRRDAHSAEEVRNVEALLDESGKR